MNETQFIKRSSTLTSTFTLSFVLRTGVHHSLLSLVYLFISYGVPSAGNVNDLDRLTQGLDPRGKIFVDKTGQ